MGVMKVDIDVSGTDDEYNDDDDDDDDEEVDKNIEKARNGEASGGPGGQVCTAPTTMEAAHPQVSSSIFSSNKSIVRAFKRSRVRRFVDLYAGSHYCPQARCNMVVLLDDAQVKRSDLNFGSSPLAQTVFCSSGHSFCLVCQEEGHAPCSCEDWRRWTNSVSKQMKSLGAEGSADTNDLANKLWLSANTKKCPRCNGFIEKDEGCNHMTCANCKYDFCWMCMRPWSEHSSRTGGYFVCNRFSADEAQDSGSSGGTKW